MNDSCVNQHGLTKKRLNVVNHGSQIGVVKHVHMNG